jgi:hypothetical protein
MTDLLPASGEVMLHDEQQLLDPLGDAEEGVVKNRAKVGSARPSSLLYTYGPGAIMDLPNFSIMPAGLDDWETIWNAATMSRASRAPPPQRRPTPPRPPGRRPASVPVAAQAQGHVQRRLTTLASQVGCSRNGSAAPAVTTSAPASVPLHQYPSVPTGPRAVHPQELPRPRRQRTGSKKSGSPAVPAQHLLTCTNGHLDEFPYSLWVHRGKKCPKAELPDLKMRDANVGKSVGSTIACASCGQTRGMAEAQGSIGREKLPQKCRGRHPHLNAFDNGCDARPALIMMGASNLWFASTQSIIVMPRTDAEEKEALADRLRVELGVEQVKQFGTQIDVIKRARWREEHRPQRSER